MSSWRASMMADTALEILKTIGSISGIFAAAFLIWDRYTKHFPLAIIVAQPLMPGSQNIVLFLGVANFSDRPILVSWKNKDVNSVPYRQKPISSRRTRNPV